jgi:phosphatidylinositol-4,5-bisphosphate 3-kinase
MKCTGIPELQSVEDLEYLRSVLVLGRTDAEAKEHFRSEIHRCLKLQFHTQLNWLSHNFVHSRN